MQESNISKQFTYTFRVCDVTSLYYCPYPITGSKIPKWDYIFNCCHDCPRMNDPFLESSEQIDHFFPASLHQNKFHIFQNISKCSIHGSIPFKYNDMCELCDNILDKDKRGMIMVQIFCSTWGSYRCISWQSSHLYNIKTIILYLSW